MIKLSAIRQWFTEEYELSEKKFFEKTFRKGLTNEKSCDIINKLSLRKRLPGRQEEHLEN